MMRAVLNMGSFKNCTLHSPGPKSRFPKNREKCPIGFFEHKHTIMKEYSDPISRTCKMLPSKNTNKE